MIAAFIFEAVLRRLTRDPTGPSEGPLGPGEHCPFPWGRCGRRVSPILVELMARCSRLLRYAAVYVQYQNHRRGNGGTAGVCSAPPSGHTPSAAWRRAEGTGLDGKDASRPIIHVSTMRVIFGHCRKIKSQVSQISPICRSIGPSYPGPDGDWRVNAINRLLGWKTPDRRICETIFFHVIWMIDVSQIDHHRASH
jgi:hypothetical protein